MGFRKKSLTLQTRLSCSAYTANFIFSNMRSILLLHTPSLSAIESAKELISPRNFMSLVGSLYGSNRDLIYLTSTYLDQLT